MIKEEVKAVDFYNGTIAETAATLHTAAATDKDHTGGRNDCNGRRTEAFGMSFDVHMGFPIMKESSQTLKIGGDVGGVLVLLNDQGGCNGY